MAEVTLRPCPFCGESPEVRWDGDFGSDDDWCAIECVNPECPATSVFVDYETRDEAVEAWNRRAS